MGQGSRELPPRSSSASLLSFFAFWARRFLGFSKKSQAKSVVEQEATSRKGCGERGPAPSTGTPLFSRYGLESLPGNVDFPLTESSTSPARSAGSLRSPLSSVPQTGKGEWRGMKS